MSRIGLLDVDGRHFPNVPLMKLSAYHKAQGDEVEMVTPISQYDRVYVAKVFTFTPDEDFPIQAGEIIRGGTGYDLQNKLPSKVESIYPDYSLYPQFSEAYGFLTRGCPRRCEFCVVSAKEGCVSRQVADLHDFWRGQKTIKLLDANLLACRNRERLLHQLIESKAYIDFTQGLDIRLADKGIAEMLMRCRIKMLHFAWDGEKGSDVIIKKLEQFKQYTNIDERKARVYVLTNYDTEFSFDLERIYTLKRLGYDPYVMIYDKADAPRNVRLLQRWVNNKRIFRICERFEDYDPAMG